MIKNNRPIAINLSYAGKHIGFLAGETKNLSHMFSPIEEIKLARSFGLTYIPDPNIQKELPKTTPTTAVEKNEMEKKLETISEQHSTDIKNKEVQAKLEKTEIVEEEISQKVEEEENKKITNVEVEAEGRKIRENDLTPLKDQLKETVEIVEETEETKKTEEKPKMFLKKPEVKKDNSKAKDKKKKK